MQRSTMLCPACKGGPTAASVIYVDFVDNEPIVRKDVVELRYVCGYCRGKGEIFDRAADLAKQAQEFAQLVRRIKMTDYQVAKILNIKVKTVDRVKRGLSQVTAAQMATLRSFIPAGRKNGGANAGGTTVQNTTSGQGK